MDPDPNLSVADPATLIRKVLLLGQVAEGTSRYGSGMLGLFRPSHERKIVQYCIDLYQRLQVDDF
jgi:hypothetical protein